MKFWNVMYALGTLVVLSIIFAGVAAGADYTRCIEATCRISSSGGVGTGCVYSVESGYAYVLTNEHVVGRSQSVFCEFWRQGHISRKLQGVVVTSSQEADAAIVAIPLESFGGSIPPSIPFADEPLEVGETVMSVGCANGSWATTFIGHVRGDDGEEIRFLPSPANGRSGSAIFSEDGRCIVGLVRARTMNHVGLACTIRRVIRFLKVGVRRVSQRLIFGPCQDHLVQYNNSGECQTPGQCGPEGCPTPAPGRDSRLFPRRNMPYQQPYQTQPQPYSQAYPTLPLVPIRSRTDLSGVEQRLDGLTSSIDTLVDELRAANPPPAKVTPVAPKAVTEAPVAPIAPVVVVAPKLLGVPADQIAERVTQTVDAATEQEGTFGQKAKAGIANLLARESEDGAVSNTLIKGLLGSLLGPWGLIAAFGVIWIKNRFFSSWSRSLDPTKQDTPAQTRQKEGAKALTKEAVKEALNEKGKTDATPPT